MFCRFFVLMIIIPILYGGSLNCQDITNVKGGYKQCTSFRLDSNSGELQSGNGYKSGLYEFDSKGNIIIMQHFMSDGSLWSKTGYKYNGKGLMTEKQVKDKNGKPDSKSTYKYDKKGNLIGEKINYRDQKTFDNIVFEYDSNGRKISETYFVENGGMDSETTYIYDGNGRLAMEDDYDPIYGVVMSKIFFNYDENGNNIEILEYNNYEYSDTEGFSEKPGKLLYKTLFKFDNYGNIIEKIEYNYRSSDKPSVYKTDYLYSK
jgi:hypothetical protein